MTKPIDVSPQIVHGHSSTMGDDYQLNTTTPVSYTHLTLPTTERV